jgi:mannose/fructose/N-acetylgalactosamine-specific phosphotransferase system component IID
MIPMKVPVSTKERKYSYVFKIQALIKSKMRGLKPIAMLIASWSVLTSQVRKLWRMLVMLGKKN